MAAPLIRSEDKCCRINHFTYNSVLRQKAEKKNICYNWEYALHGYGLINNQMNNEASHTSMCVVSVSYCVWHGTRKKKWMNAEIILW